MGAQPPSREGLPHTYRSKQSRQEGSALQMGLGSTAPSMSPGAGPGRSTSGLDVLGLTLPSGLCSALLPLPSPLQQLSSADSAVTFNPHHSPCLGPMLPVAPSKGLLALGHPTLLPSHTRAGASSPPSP